MNELLKKLKSVDGHELHPVASEDDLVATERGIGRPLPDSLRAFLTQFSNGAFVLGIQVAAAGTGNEQISAIQEIGLSVDPSTRVDTDSGEAINAGDLVPFSLDSNGNAWCLITSDQPAPGEYAVVYYATGLNRAYCRLDGFETWLSTLLDNGDEVIRTVCDEHVLYDELELG